MIRRYIIAAGFAMLAAGLAVSTPASAKPLFANGIHLFGGKAPKVGNTMGIGCPLTALATGVASDQRRAVVNGVAGGALCIAAVSAGAMIAGPAGAAVGAGLAGIIAPALAASQKRRLQQ